MTDLDSLGLNLKDKGNRYQGLCPFHADKTPSFAVYKPGLNYVCFACGAKGSYTDLVQHITGEALKISPFPIYEERLESRELKNVNYKIEGELFDVYSNPQVLNYCWTIGLSDEFIKFFEVSYFKKAKFLDPRITDSKDFYNRLMIPCYYEGKIYNYECRDYTKRSSIKVLYPLGAEPDILFNWDNLDKSEVVYIVEGIKGLAKMWSFGYKNVVSTFGKLLKPHQIELIKTLPKVCIIPDNDLNKIDKKTNKPVDNVEVMMAIYDEFYPREYEVAIITQEGSDTNNLTRTQMRDLILNKKKASDLIIERSRLFESKTYNYLETIK